MTKRSPSRTVTRAFLVVGWVLCGALIAAMPSPAAAGPVLDSPTPTATPTPTCVATGTPFCSSNCGAACPSNPPQCNPACNCLANPECDLDAACVPNGSGPPFGCCACQTHTPAATATPTPPAGCAETPVGGCRLAATGMVDLRDDDGDLDKLTWKWAKGASTTFDDYGDPATGMTSYRLCLYDETAGVAALKLGIQAPAGGTCADARPCWRQTGSTAAPKGFRYKDRDMSPNGIRGLTLKRGDDGRPRITLSAKGPALPLPTPVSPTQFFQQQTRVIVQLVRSDGGPCWETVHSAPARTNSGNRFKARY